MNNKYNNDTSKNLTVGMCKITKNISLYAHYHKQTEFVYVVEGNLSLCVNNNIYDLKKGDYAVIRSLDIHSFVLNEKNTKVFLLILPDIFSVNLSEVNIKTMAFDERNDDIDKMVKMYKQFKSLNEKYRIFYYQMFFEAIKSLYTSSEQKTESVENRIVNYINSHIKDELTLNSVALACNTNRSYVSRTINELYSISFVQYINRLRVSAFLDLYLKEDNKSTIEDIATSVGFTNIRTFYRAFNKELHCKPTEYFGL